MKFHQSLTLFSLIFMAQNVQAATVLPMLYMPENVNLNQPNANTQLLLGAFPEMSANGKISVKPSTTIYVAPQAASVRATKAKVYPVANCSVVKQAIGDEKSISQLLHDNSELLLSYGEEVKTYAAESKSARAACLASKKTKSSDSEELCDYAKDVSNMMKDISGELSDWTQQINTTSDAFLKRYENIASQPGGYTVATVQLWDPADIEAVKVANPGYSATLVPLKKVDFSFTTAEEGLAGAANGGPSLRTVLGFSLAGQSTTGGTPSGATPEASAQVLSGSNIALGITLSRFGACDSSLVRGATFHYDYDAFAFVHGTAMINKWQVYERIEKNKSKGGFFTTSSVHSLYEDLKAGSIHSVLVEGVPDKDFALATDQLSAVILDDLLRDVSFPQNVPADPSALIGLPAPSANGASVIADGVSKCPNLYCQVGAFALKGLSAVFGGMTNESSIKQAYDKKVAREYGYTTKVDGHGSSSTLVEWALTE